MVNRNNGKKKNEITIRSSAAEYLTFVASSGESGVEVRYEDENIWLTQKLMAELYDVNVRTINEHIKKIFSDNELTGETVIRNFRITASDGKTYNTNHYNLQVIIAVGFKVNNERAVRFRKWASQIVKDYTIQGWTMDVERLKKGHMFTDENHPCVRRHTDTWDEGLRMFSVLLCRNVFLQLAFWLVGLCHFKLAICE